jgi:capsular exopolysaccharide synthesis family protein
VEEVNQLARLEPAGPIARRGTPPLFPIEVADAEESPDLLAYWRTIRKRRWTILTVLVIVFAVALIGTLKQKPIYRGRALLEIQKENPDVASLKELFELESVSDTYLETQFRVLASESLAYRVIEQLQLEKLEEFDPPKPWWSFGGDRKAATQPAVAGLAPESDPDVRQQVLLHFQDALSIDPVKRSRLVAVSFESTDADRAARIVNTLAANYIEQSLEARWKATQKATEWLSQQLLGLKARLEKSEDELQKYARENGLIFLESEKGKSENIFDERLRQLQEELTRAQAARFEKESLYRLVQTGDFVSLPGIAENKLIQDLTVRLADLRREQALLSTTFNPEYPKVKQLQNQIDEVDGIIARERQHAAERITNDYIAAQKRESFVRTAFEQQEKQANQIAGRSVQYNILKRETDTNKQLYEGLLQRMKEAGVSAGLKASNVRIVDPAEPPRKPVKPRIVLNLSLALFFGLALGIGAAFLQEHLDNTLKTSEDVKRFVHLPTLAVIPSVESLNGRAVGAYGFRERMKLLSNGNGHGEKSGRMPTQWYRIDTAEMEHSVLSEAFRGLRTSVLLSSVERPPRTLIVSSAQPTEGKTTVSTNLAISLSQLRHKVLIIDGDMRRPALHHVFNLPEEPGLVNYLTGERGWRDVVQPTGIPGLSALVTGQIPFNPAELLSLERMRSLILEAAAEYNFVLLDSPPLVNVADSRILSTMVEGVILVVRAGATPRDLVQRAQAYTSSVGSPIFGVVLNNLDVREDASEYKYYRADYYGPRRDSTGAR